MRVLAPCCVVIMCFVASCSDDTAVQSTPSDAGAPDAAEASARETTPETGADAAMLTGTVIAAGAPAAAGVWSTSLATDGTHVYWLEGGAVKRVPVGGGSVEDVAAGQAQPTGIVAAPNGVLWANQGDGTIMRLAPGASSASVVAAAATKPNALAVDAAFVYWVEQTAGPPTGVRPGAVARAPLGGGAVEVLTNVPAPGMLGNLALLGDEVYFTDLGAPDSSFVGPVARTKAAPDAGAPETIAPDQKEPTGIASNGSIVAWANQGSLPASFSDGSIVTYAKGGTPTTIAMQRNNPGFIAIDASYVYWQERVVDVTSRIMKAKTSGGEPTVVAEIVAGPGGPASGFTIDGANVYWAANGSIRRAPK